MARRFILAWWKTLRSSATQVGLGDEYHEKDRKVIPIDTSKRINERGEERLQAWKQEHLLLHTMQVVVRSTQHKSVHLVYGGNRERILERASGNQEIQGKEGDERAAEMAAGI